MTGSRGRWLFGAWGRMGTGIMIVSALLLAGTRAGGKQADKGSAGEAVLARALASGLKVEKVAGGYQFLEGPLWTKRNTLLFSDTPGDTIFEYTGSGSPRPFQRPAFQPNGNTLDPQGRLITCRKGSRSVTRMEKKGGMTTLAERFEGKRLNAPNDVAARSNGDLYFTDPPYGVTPEQEELHFYGVFRLAKDGTLTAQARDFVKPNGIAFSPDEKRLYVDDTDRRHIRVFDVKPNGDLENGRVFAEVQGRRPGAPDGLKVDRQGNVYCTGSGGIHVFTPSGKELGVIDVPEVAANCAFGDRDMKTLYLTAGTSLYRVRLPLAGKR